MVLLVKLLKNNFLNNILYRDPEVSWLKLSAGPIRSVQVKFYCIGEAFHLFCIKSYEALCVCVYVCVWGGGGGRVCLFLNMFILLVTYVK